MNILRDRDWTVVDTSSGMACEDGFCIDPFGTAWAVEVKNTQSITTAHRRQAMAQAKKRRANWMLLSKIEGTPCWLVQRQGMKPTVWSEKESENDT